MIKRVFIEIKQLLKSRIIQLLFVLVIIFTFFHSYTLDSYEENRLNLIINEYYDANFIYYRLTYSLTVDPEDESYYIQRGAEYYDDLIDALENNDMQRYMELKIRQQILFLLPAENFYDTLSDIVIDMYSSNMTRYDDVQELKKELDFNEDVKYRSNNGIGAYDQDVFWMLDYNYAYYKSGATPISYTLRSSPGALIDYARDFHFIAFIISAIVVSSYSLYADNKDGVLKTILMTNSNRTSYLLTKIISCSLVSVIVSLLPPLLVVLYQSGTSFFTDIDLPLYAYKNTFSSFEPFLFGEVEIQYSDIVNKSVAVVRTHLNYLPKAATRYSGTADAFVVAARQLTLQPLYFYLIFISFMTGLFTTLISSITVFFTSLSKKRANGIIFTVIVLAGLYALTMFTAYDSVLAVINPLTYVNIPALIEGSLPYTYLMATICLAVFILIFIVGSCLAFKKKDV